MFVFGICGPYPREIVLFGGGVRGNVIHVSSIAKTSDPVHFRLSNGDNIGSCEMCSSCMNTNVSWRPVRFFILRN